MTLCDYGCGQEAIYQFKNGKWCCSESHNACPGFKLKLKNICITKYGIENPSQLKETKEKMSESKQFYLKIPVDNNILCEYGCGQPARYILNKINQKFCCSKFYNSCSVMIELNKKTSGKANGSIDKREKHSELMKKENPMFIKEYRNKVVKITSSYKYKKMMSEKLEKMWEESSFIKKTKDGRIRSGCQIPDKDVTEFRKYYNKVYHYTRKSIKKYNDIINPENKPIGIKNGFYNIDHIYSIFDGFTNNISPIIIGSYINLQVMPWIENLKKNKNSWLTEKELINRYNKNENI